MSMIEQFQKLDDLIIEHTQLPVRTILRNQLALTREQVEAYQESSDKQDQTLAAQVETIERLMKEKEAVDAENAALKAGRQKSKDDFFAQKARDTAKSRESQNLNHTRY